MQPALQMCIDAGFDTIEHACHLTVEQAKQMADKGQAVVSTSYVYEYLCDFMKALPADSPALYKSNKEYLAFQSNIEAYKKNFPEIYKTGVTILAGTDCPFDGVEHITVAWELECMVKCGMSPVEAIATAALSPSKVLGMEGEIGLLAPGAIADITIADATADKDITALKRIKDVYQSGTKVSL
jgi:imidazolonepropionase-like amidohydrolase